MASAPLAPAPLSMPEPLIGLDRLSDVHSPEWVTSASFAQLQSTSLMAEDEGCLAAGGCEDDEYFTITTTACAAHRGQGRASGAMGSVAAAEGGRPDIPSMEDLAAIATLAAAELASEQKVEGLSSIATLAVAKEDSGPAIPSLEDLAAIAIATATATATATMAAASLLAANEFEGRSSIATLVVAKDDGRPAIPTLEDLAAIAIATATATANATRAAAALLAAKKNAEGRFFTVTLMVAMEGRPATPSLKDLAAIANATATATATATLAAASLLTAEKALVVAKEDLAAIAIATATAAAIAIATATAAAEKALVVAKEDLAAIAIATATATAAATMAAAALLASEKVEGRSAIVTLVVSKEDLAAIAIATATATATATLSAAALLATETAEGLSSIAEVDDCPAKVKLEGLAAIAIVTATATARHAAAALLAENEAAAESSQELRSLRLMVAAAMANAADGYERCARESAVRHAMPPRIRATPQISATGEHDAAAI
ncbi:hypothetical protein FOA52_002019 [Chlamydomonas sp. UWO 241]|nr:hypothetical protein FOA52_002019 [Chlamydomonas sp. UWO 241]